MKHIHHLLAGHRVGIISAHPDDHIIQTHAIMAAHAADAPICELTLTRGLMSTVNHTDDPTFVTSGRRRTEGEDAAAYMGILSNDHLDAPDGQLAAHQDTLVPLVAEWIAHHGIDLLLTLGGAADHPDHIAAGAIARRAGIQLWDEDAYAVGALEVQLTDTGEWGATATYEGQAMAFGAAALHGSQFMVRHSPLPAWEQTAGGLYVHEDSLRGLDQYPIRRAPSFTWLSPAVLGEAVQIEPAYGQP